MKKWSVFAWCALAASAVLAVVSYCLLPETVITQFSIQGSNASTLPKAAAVLIPTVIGAGGALFALFTKSDEKNRAKSLIVSAVGIAVFIIMLAVNL